MTETVRTADWPALWQQLLAWAEGTLPGLLKALIVLVLGWWLASFLTKLLQRAMRRSKADEGVCAFIASLCKISLRIVVLISAAASLGVNVTSIVTALGAAGVTAGLALKDSLSNFASGVLILFNKPFKVGDYLELSGTAGTVHSIGLMYTTLMTPDNKAVLLPNSSVTSEKIVNASAQPQRRIDLSFSIAYGADIERAKQVLAQAATACPFALSEPAPLFAVTAHEESAVILSAYIWCEAGHYLDAKFDLMERVKYAFDEQGITIPFPQMDIHLVQ